MRVYEFMLTLATEPDLDTIDQLYEYFEDNGAAIQKVSWTLHSLYNPEHRLRTVLWKPRRSRQPWNRYCQNCVKKVFRSCEWRSMRWDWHFFKR